MIRVHHDQERARMTNRIAYCYATGMAQLVTRIDEDLATALDGLVASGAVASRSDAVRQALERLIDDHRRASVAAEIVHGYQRVPQTDDDLWSDTATVAMIAEEPW